MVAAALNTQPEASNAPFRVRYLSLNRAFRPRDLDLLLAVSVHDFATVSAGVGAPAHRKILCCLFRFARAYAVARAGHGEGVTTALSDVGNLAGRVAAIDQRILFRSGLARRSPMPEGPVLAEGERHPASRLTGRFVLCRRRYGGHAALLENSGDRLAV